MDRIFLRPAADVNATQEPGSPVPRLKVRKPIGKHLADAGEWVDRDSYWLRRLADKDVEEATPPPAEAKAPAAGPGPGPGPGATVKRS